MNKIIFLTIVGSWGIYFMSSCAVVPDEDYAVIKAIHEAIEKDGQDFMGYPQGEYKKLLNNLPNPDQKKILAMTHTLKPGDGGNNLLHALAEKNDDFTYTQNIIKKLSLDQKLEALQARNSEGNSPLHCAALAMSKTLVAFLSSVPDNSSQKKALIDDLVEKHEDILNHICDAMKFNESHLIMAGGKPYRDLAGIDNVFEFLLYFLKVLPDSINKDRWIIGEVIKNESHYAKNDYTPLSYALKYYKKYASQKKISDDYGGRWKEDYATDASARISAVGGLFKNLSEEGKKSPALQDVLSNILQERNKQSDVAQEALKIYFGNVSDPDILQQSLDNLGDQVQSVVDIYPEAKEIIEKNMSSLPAKLSALKRQLKGLRKKLEDLKTALDGLAGELKAPTVVS